jgi:subtilase family serine protease
MTRSITRVGIVALLIAAGPFAAIASSSSAEATTSPSNFIYRVNPLMQVARGDTFTSPFCSSGALICYTPSDIKTAYGYPPNLDGSTQTIVIVDAYGSPTVQQDLAAFDAQFYLPAPPHGLQVVCPSGCPTFNPNNRAMDEIGWAEETSLDVQWAHAMAPGANLVLAVAPTAYGDAVNSTEAKIFSDPAYRGAIISQSFGQPENLITANNAQVLQGDRNYAMARQLGLTVLASSGDLGATNIGMTPNAVFPSSDPNVTAVGGTQGDPYYSSFAGLPLPTCATTLFGQPCSVGLATVECSASAICPTIGYGGEAAWREDWLGSATGGAPSLLFEAPSYQANDGSDSPERTTPDISYDAAISGGVLVYLSCIPGVEPGFHVLGGTSAGSPQMAAIVALAAQARGASIGFLNDKLYALAENPTTYAADFHDIVTGDNTLAGTPFGYTAHTGYDLATGWGTPKVGNLVASLASDG